jgi:hypothetical protein
MITRFNEEAVKRTATNEEGYQSSGSCGYNDVSVGTDFIVARNGRIASVYLFFDNLP